MVRYIYSQGIALYYINTYPASNALSPLHVVAGQSSCALVGDASTANSASANTVPRIAAKGGGRGEGSGCSHKREKHEQYFTAHVL